MEMVSARTKNRTLWEKVRGKGVFGLPAFGKRLEYIKSMAYTAWMRNFGDELFPSQDRSMWSMVLEDPFYLKITYTGIESQGESGLIVLIW